MNNNIEKYFQWNIEGDEGVKQNERNEWERTRTCGKRERGRRVVELEGAQSKGVNKYTNRV